MTLILDGAQRKRLCEALGVAFSLKELKRMVRFRLNLDLEDVSEAGTKADVIYELVEYASRRDLVRPLVEGARAENPANPALAAFLDTLGLDPVPAAAARALERIVNERATFADAVGFRERLGRIEAWICRTEMPGSGGTGFLVAPDLVLTNHHVMAPVIEGKVSPRDVTFRFDFKATTTGAVVVTGTPCGLAMRDWEVASSPPSEADARPTGGEPGPDQLDYALVRLDRKLGESPIGGDPGAPSRGWLSVPSTPPGVVAGDPFFVIQHPRGQHLQLALGKVLGFAGGGSRVRHDAPTLHGSSGSPCFDASLALVALHHTGDPDYDPQHKPQYNQAIAVGRIVAQMQTRQVESFWDKTPR
jgi:Trypsin-like peptidase domain/Effector-associated domain 1